MKKRVIKPDPDTDSDDSEDDGGCSKCHCQFKGYQGPDWLECRMCHIWFCGNCVIIDSDEFLCDCELCIPTNETTFDCGGSSPSSDADNMDSDV